MYDPRRARVVGHLCIAALVIASAHGEVTAQQRREPFVDLRSAALAALARHTDGSLSAVQRDDGWQSVQDLAETWPGEPILLTLTGGTAAPRWLLAADRTHITVIDVMHPRLTDPVRRVLVEAARDDPERYTRAQQGLSSVISVRPRVELTAGAVVHEGSSLVRGNQGGLGILLVGTAAGLGGGAAVGGHRFVYDTLYSTGPGRP